jgi:hypothetical protein
MELKLDVKTLIIGIVAGVIITAALGLNGGSADKADFGIAVEDKGFALVKTSDDSFYIVDAERSTAEAVVDKSKGARNRALNLSTSSRGVRATGGY